jgi:hypothetical protein
MVSQVMWIAAVVLGLVGGGFAFHFPGSYGEPNLSVDAAVFGLMLGAVHGSITGVLVWTTLRLSRRRGLRVVAAMALSIGGTHALNDGSSTQLPFVVVEILAGLVCLGAWAWIIGERRSSVLAVIGIAWSVGIVVAGWSGDAMGLPLTETPFGWAQDHGWDGLVTGLVWGIATAAAGVPDTLRRPHQTTGPSPARASG